MIKIYEVIGTLANTVQSALAEEYRRSYQDGLKEHETTERYWGNKSEKSCVTCSKLYLNCDKITCTLNDHAHWTPKQTNEIKVGDEVIYQGGGIYDGSKGVVIGTCDKWCEVRFISSWSAVGVYNDTLTKTGRYFPQIAEVLKQMQEDKTE